MTSLLKKSIVIIAKVLFLCILAIPFFTNIAEQTLNGDENAYLRGSRYFKLFFLDRDYAHPLWQNVRAYDQPPIGKYIYGLGILLTGNKDSYSILARLKDWNYEEDYEWNAAHGRVAPLSVGYQIRYIAALFGYATCLLLYWIVSYVFNKRTGVISALLLAYNPLMLMCSKRIMTNSLINCFLLAGVVVLLLYERALREHKKKHILGLACVMGAIIAIATGTKLNGGLVLIYFVIFCIMVVIECVVSLITRTHFTVTKAKQRVITMCTSLLLMLFVGGALFILPNPYLYDDPVGGTVHMIDYRMHKAEKLQTYPEHTAIETCSEKVGFAADRCLVNEFTLLRDYTHFPFEAILFFIGIALFLYTTIKDFKKNRMVSPRSIIIIWIIATIVGTLAWLPLDWHFYYLPIIPCVVCMIAYAIDLICSFATKRLKQFV